MSADQSPDQEPSIEEILASIRQIIADDDEGEEQAAAEPDSSPEPEPTPAPEPISEPEPEPTPEPEEPEDVFELTEDMQDTPAEPEPEPEPVPEIDMEPSEPLQGIVSDAAASATLQSLSKLTGDMPINRRAGYSGVTVEDIVRELLNPMLRDWVDGNLAPMVERLVQKELEKLARKALDD